MMVYTSGLMTDPAVHESLETLQTNKLNRVVDLVQIRGDSETPKEMLDIGCGWGTLAVHAAASSNARVTGVTLGLNQHAWAMNRIYFYSVLTTL